MNEDVFRKIAERLRETVSPSVPINYDTEVYYDLNIYGHDLFELFCWIELEYGVQIAAPGDRYAPSEMPLLQIMKLIKRGLGLREFGYKNLKVGDIVEAIEAKDRRAD